MQVEVWSDVVCPWCYLGRRYLEQAIASVPFGDDVEVTLRSFELDPATPAGVTTPGVDALVRKYGMTEQQVHASHRQMEDRAAAAGLEFRLGNQRHGNSRAAHRLLHLAKERGRQAEFAEALHRAYFVEERDVFGRDSLLALAAEAGLDPAEAADVLDGDRFRDAVEADEELAYSFGVTGVPFFVVDRRYGVSGAQPADVLAGVLLRAHEE